MKYRLTVKGQVALATVILLIFFAVGSIGLSLKSKPSDGQVAAVVANSKGPAQTALTTQSEQTGESMETQSSETASKEAPSKEILKKITATVYFKPDQWEMQADEIQKLNEIIEPLRTYPKLKVIIEGNINGSNGSTDSNFGKELSLKRAQVVAKVLIGKGIDDSRILVKSNGSSEPVATDRDCAWMNRRTYLYIEGFKGENP